MTFARAKAKHLHPMGAGFYQVGMHVSSLILPSVCPELKSLRIR
jgi:hypothetical protein